MRRLLSATSWLLAGAIGMLLAAELLLRLLPVIDGRIRGADESRWPLHNYRPNEAYTYSFGWDLRHPQQGRVNNFGQLAPFDYVPGRARVAVIGDSYVESAMNRYDETLPARLSSAMGDPHAAIGLAGSGLSLADYAALASQARTELAPRALVFVIIDGDIAESVQPRQGWHHYASTADGRTALRMMALRSGQESALSGRLAGSALYRYLRRNLGWVPPDPRSWLRRAETAPTRSEADRQAAESAQRQAIARFVQDVGTAAGGGPSCVALLFDSDRGAMYGSPARIAVDSPQMDAELARQAHAAGLQVVPLEPSFIQDYARHHQRFDHSPFDRHWNARGHAVAAAAALQALPAHCLSASAP